MQTEISMQERFGISKYFAKRWWMETKKSSKTGRLVTVAGERTHVWYSLKVTCYSEQDGEARPKPRRVVLRIWTLQEGLGPNGPECSRKSWASQFGQTPWGMNTKLAARGCRIPSSGPRDEKYHDQTGNQLH